MELKDLVGKHYFSGFDTIMIDDYEVVRFVLDSKTYKATEDPSDGYRSYLSDIEVTNEIVSNTFPPQEVVGVMDNKNDLIHFIDTTTGKIVLCIGTADSDDYYPSCVMYFSPENLSINRNHE